MAGAGLRLVLGGLGFAVLYAPLLSATSEWFERHRGMAVGIVTAGGALGQGVLPFLANMLIDGMGWRLAFLAVAIGNLTALGLLLPRVTRPQSSRLPAKSLSQPLGIIAPHHSLAATGPPQTQRRLTKARVAARAVERVTNPEKRS